MRKLSPVLLLFFLPALAACDAGEAVAPQGEVLEVESERLARAGNRDHATEEANRHLAALRRATVAYHDPAAARADGYHMEEACISASALGAPPELGAMGYHFVNQKRIDGTIEPLKPEALVYEKRSDGKLHFVAVEYLFVGDEAPELAGQHFHEFIPPFADFELHAWIWKANPNGTFADFNPTVSCPTS